MHWLNLLGVAVALAMDAFAVSIGAGLTIEHVTPRHMFRMAFHFGLFQALMPAMGWLLGSSVSPLVADYDHWVVFGLLTGVAGKMLFDAFTGKDRADRRDPTRGLMLIVLSIATSIDAFAVGLSLAILNVPILLPCLLIGLVAAFFSFVGIAFAGQFLRRWSKAAEVMGAVLLLLIGVRILVTHIHEAI